MLENFIINQLLKKEIIQKDDVEIYRFGMECFLLKIINYVSFIMIGYLMKMPLELIFIAFSFVPIRRSAGGYHAKTRKICFVISCGIVVNALVLCIIIDSMYIWFLFLAISNIIIFVLAPIDNEANKMSNYEKTHYRKKTLVIISLLNILCVVLMMLKKDILYQGIIAGIISASLLLFMGSANRMEGK